MRQETNKEIDLLLRRLSGRDGEAVRDSETQLDDRHLDADELSSYAQNVAPPKARVRYTEHLAECSTCRRLATELSLALGVTTAAAPVETVPAASGLKKFLSSLFSPLVLRYAVPALGAIVVMVIGFVVMRQRSQYETFVAQNEGRQVAAPNYSTQAPASPAAGAFDDQRAEQRAGAKAENPSPLAGATDPGRISGETAPKEPKQEAAGTADSAAAAPAPVTTTPGPEVLPYTQRRVNELPVVQATPAASLSPKANITTDGIDEAKKKEISAKREAQPVAKTDEAKTEKEQANEPPPRDAPRAAKSVAANRAEESKARPDTNAVSPAGAGGVRAARGRRDEDSKDDAETRSVAGRRFRKDDGIWTDTAYDSSTRTVNMARGSEQFRALVADEPAIGTIAEQLDGVVIVVWKGRAYRIR
jgi:hypothetical protein